MGHAMPRPDFCNVFLKGGHAKTPQPARRLAVLHESTPHSTVVSEQPRAKRVKVPLASSRRVAVKHATPPPPVIATSSVGDAANVDCMHRSLLVGNVQSWGAARLWLRNRTECADKTPKLLLLRGSSGVGKTSGAHILVETAGRRVVEVNAGECRKTDIEQIIREGCTRAAILSDGTTSVASAAVVLIDDLEAYTKDTLAMLVSTLSSIENVTGIICTCSLSHHLPAFFKDTRECRVLWFHSLSITELCTVARRALLTDIQRETSPKLIAMSNWSSSSMMRFAARANGDARRLLIMIELEKSSASVTESIDTTPLLPGDEFDSARALLFGFKPSVASTDVHVSQMGSEFLAHLLFHNYVDALTASQIINIDTLAEAADRFSVADIIRVGPIRSQTMEAWILQGSVGMLGGLKTGNPRRPLIAPKVMRNVESTLSKSYLRETCHTVLT